MLLPLWRKERVLCDDDQLLVVDKPPGIVVHGGDPEDLDVVRRLEELLAAEGREPYLGVHQRLDKDASGVLLFARSASANAALSRELGEQRLHRRYLAVVSGAALPDSGLFEHRLLARKGDTTRVVERGGQLARARYRVLARSASRSLVELSPETGRTHQLRVQLAAAGAPICGDTIYGGTPADRLMLHASELEVRSLGRRFAAEVPAELEECLRREAPRLTLPRIGRLLGDAAVRRHALQHRTQAFRLVNDGGDLLPGLVVDCYGAHAVVSVASQELEVYLPAIAETLLALGAGGVYLKRRVRADLRRTDARVLAPEEPIAGRPAPAAIEIGEAGLTFEVALADGLSTGLFLDQRDNRTRVRQTSRGLRVLNLFAYTCSFSVAAASGGAREVVSVDLSARALERGRRNFELNRLDARIHRAVRADVLEWLPRAIRKGERFDLVILDPPSFGTRAKGRSFRSERHYTELAGQALSLLGPRGRLLAVTNHAGTSLGDLRKNVRCAAEAARRNIVQLKDLTPPLDCPGPAPSKSVLVTLG